MSGLIGPQAQVTAGQDRVGLSRGDPAQRQASAEDRLQSVECRARGISKLYSSMGRMTDQVQHVIVSMTWKQAEMTILL